MIGDVSRTRAALTALSLIPALLVTGCSDDDPKPKFGPTPSATPSSTPSSATSGPTTPLPTLPPEAQGTGPDAAEAFVKFYWATVNYAQATGDIDALRKLGDNSCKACRGGVGYLEEVFAAQ